MEDIYLDEELDEKDDEFPFKDFMKISTMLSEEEREKEYRNVQQYMWL